jgi:hypothetical protein
MRREFQLISLANFLQSFFLPCAKKVQAEPPGPKRPTALRAEAYGQKGTERLEEQVKFQLEEIPRRLAKFAVWESYFCLHLGVELELFPRDEAVAVLKVQFNPPDLSGEPGFDYMPGGLRNLYSRVLIGSEAFPETVYGQLRVNPAFQAALQSILQLEACSEREALARNFTGAISFMTDQVWESVFFEPASKGNRLLERKLSIEGLALAYEGDSEWMNMDVEIEKVVVGFYKTLEQMAHLQQLFLDLRGIGDISKDQQLIFERRVREICNWRLNFLNPKIKQRFYQLVEPAMERVKAAILRSGEIGGPIEVAKQPDAEFLEVLKKVGDPWTNLVIGDLTWGQNV